MNVMVKGCTDARCKKNMVQCSNPTCDIIAHSCIDGENKRFIFDIPCFVGKSCFDIAQIVLEECLWKASLLNQDKEERLDGVTDCTNKFEWNTQK